MKKILLAIIPLLALTSCCEPQEPQWKYDAKRITVYNKEIWCDYQNPICYQIVSETAINVRESGNSLFYHTQVKYIIYFKENV